MSLTRRSANVLAWAQKRGFRARGGKEPLMPPYTVKTRFDYSETEPIKNLEKTVALQGANYEKYNALGNHYRHQEYFVNHNNEDWFMAFGGMYGPYWPAHFGGGYIKHLRRRTDVPTTYNDKNPLLNWWRRKCDERGLHFEFPRGQDYQIICSWFMGVIIFSIIFGQVKNVGAHFANAKPLPPPDDYPPRINLPFYVYIMHEIPAPNLE